LSNAVAASFDKCPDVNAPLAKGKRRMPTTRKKATKKKATPKRAAKATAAKRGRAAGKKSSATKKRRSARTVSRVPAQMKQTAMKVLAGAAAGAVRAIIPPLEKAVESNEAAAGTRKPGKQGTRDDSDT
jgi:sRNA-binding protein